MLFVLVSPFHPVYSQTPIFGVKYTIEEKSQSLSERKTDRKTDDVEIVEDVGINSFENCVLIGLPVVF
jgi:hypothetical protein